MNDDPFYNLWHPRLTQDVLGSTILVNVTPASFLLMQTGPKEFFDQILVDLGINAEAKNWRIRPYISRYHADCWGGSWLLEIVLDRSVVALTVRDEEGSGSWAQTNGEPVPYLANPAKEYLVIADFREKMAAATVAAATPCPIEIVAIGPGPDLYQLQAWIGSRQADAEALCEKFRLAGGITDWNQRVEEWGS